MKFDNPELRIIVTSKRGVEKVQVVTSPNNRNEGLALYEKLIEPIDSFTRTVKKRLAKKHEL